MPAQPDPLAEKIQFDRPHPARVWNYWLGGKDADVREPEPLLADARNVLNFRRPIAVMLLGILGHAAPEYDTMRSIIHRLMAAVAPGSYLVWEDGAVTDDAAHMAAVARQHEMGHMYQLRTPEQFREALDGFHLLEPGLVPCNQWRPDSTEVGHNEAPSNAYGVVALKI
jgi:S-adenosyl methyltransferase